MSVRVSSPDDVQFPIIENSSIQYEYSKFKQDSDANETTLLTGQITVANEGVSEISNNNFNADASETDAIIVAIILEIPFNKLFETKFRLKKITKIYTTSSFVAAMFKSLATFFRIQFQKMFQFSRKCTISENIQKMF